METVYQRIQDRARQIVSRFPVPDFYRHFPEANDLSRRHFNDNPDIRSLVDIVDRHLDNDFGHGLLHAEKVTLDAGALTWIEGRRSGCGKADIQRCMFLAQCAALLHDTLRKQKDHAVVGAAFAEKILNDFRLSPSEIRDISRAIRNHEAFKPTVKIDSLQGELISDCLYDADKFRWGPDNFTDTLWDMVSFLNPPLSVFIEKFPKGMAGLEKIKLTFRSHTGIRYGPQFIDIGIAVGKKLYRVLLEEFAYQPRR